jgi:molybdopterin/thiamine biosynthesis adenylyltransferase
MGQIDPGRDERTARFLSLFVPTGVERNDFPFRSVAARLGIDQGWARTVTGQTLLLTAANLLGRFVGRIELDVPAVAVLTPLDSRNSDLYGAAEAMAAMSNAGRGGPELPGMNVEGLPSVQIGAGTRLNGFVVHASARGWRADLGLRDPHLPAASEDSNPIGALLAAAFSASEVFKEILRNAGSTRRSVRNRLASFSFSGFDFSVDSRAESGPRVGGEMGAMATLVGAGAVANSLAFALGSFNHVDSHFRVIDPDELDESNLNRHLVAAHPDVGRPKAEVLAGFLRSHGVTTVYDVAKYQDVRQTLSDAEMRLVVSTVDNDEARIALQSDLPESVLHGATDADVTVVSRLDFLDGACLGCLFFERSKSFAESVADDTGIPLDEVVRLLETHGELTSGHVDRIIASRGTGFEELRSKVGAIFAEVYATQICGAINFDFGETRVSPTVSFVSAFPGFLIAAELLKTGSEELERHRLKNYLAISLFAPTYRQVLERPKDPRCRCLCFDPIMSSSYRRKWGRPDLRAPKTRHPDED